MRLPECYPSAMASRLSGRMIQLVALPLIALTVNAQSPAVRPEFEAVSIKPNNRAEPLFYKSYPNRFTAKNMTARLLLQLAWQTGASPISGAPAWFSAQGFDIEATTDRPVTWAQMQLMLQTLLESRFQLIVHRQTKVGLVYELVVVRSGLRIKPSLDQTPWTGDHPNEPGTTGANMDIRQGSLSGGSIPLAMFAGFLSGETGRPVINRTGLTGRYAIELRWTPFRITSAAGGESPSPDLAGESLFTAMQEQLGLKLGPSRGPVDTILIDRLERPSEN